MRSSVGCSDRPHSTCAGRWASARPYRRPGNSRRTAPRTSQDRRRCREHLHRHRGKVVQHNGARVRIGGVQDLHRGALQRRRIQRLQNALEVDPAEIGAELPVFQVPEQRKRLRVDPRRRRRQRRRASARYEAPPVHIEPPSTARWRETGFRRGKSIADSVRARPGSRQFKDTAALHRRVDDQAEGLLSGGEAVSAKPTSARVAGDRDRRGSLRGPAQQPPDLAMERHAVFADRPLDEFLAFVRLVVLAVNLALPYRASRSRSRHA